ncbi:lytic transglycosylase domain-containing protein [Gayadomonas joobiniege]|uniref:lytic transglycosylase domain-containing protein n=1 Tax=Gayadomonas joobiniege TaxID=1234606 RepID=UPI00035F3E0F|nr:lytic transglycosylase domain-containing protein [Gayadomonas joobiniege]
MKFRLTRSLWRVLLLFTPLQAMAEQPIEIQRKNFVIAEQQAASGSWRTVQKWRESLADYPLMPYIEMAYLKNHAFRANEKRINEFLRIYESTPMEWPVRKAWLNYLIEKKDAVAYLNAFKPTSDAHLTCYQHRFELQLGAKIESIADKVADLWGVNKSQPKACDPLFKVWADAGLRTHDMVRARIKKAADGGSHSLIPYLTRLLPAGERKWATAWHRTRRNPATILNSKMVKHSGDKWIEIHAYGLQRLIWRDTERALKHYQRLADKKRFTPAQQAEIAITFGLALASDQHPQALFWLQKIPPEAGTEKTRQWHLATLVRQQSWSRLISFINGLNQEQRAEAGHRYWLARAYHELGDLKKSREIMLEVAGLRHYYGFLAAARLGTKYQLNHDSIQLKPDLEKAVQTAPSAQRAYEFLQLGRDWMARHEWYKFRQTLTKEEQGHAAYLAHKWHWYDQALRGISLAGYNNDVLLRFPKAYQKEFVAASKDIGIAPSLAMAIARRESSFAADARSGAGARGLMQIMPATAKVLAGRKFDTRKLYDPQTNIKMGTGYIKSLIKRMNNSVPRAIASYNAGWGRVQDWRPEQGSMPMEVWIENIPYTETRNYVKAVLAYQQVYEMLEQQPNDIFSRIIEEQVTAND